MNTQERNIAWALAGERMCKELADMCRRMRERQTAFLKEQGLTLAKVRRMNRTQQATVNTAWAEYNRRQNQGANS